MTLGRKETPSLRDSEARDRYPRTLLDEWPLPVPTVSPRICLRQLSDWLDGISQQMKMFQDSLQYQRQKWRLCSNSRSLTRCRLSRGKLAWWIISVGGVLVALQDVAQGTLYFELRRDGSG